uniref:Zinc finger CCCH domain-containing protein 14 n=1 Tax=Syphacia muris TaxID=451379 RepID=A0A0N5APQ4_9BILA
MSSSKMFGSNSAEMSKKLRAAIKAKLEELGVYVDEELPDYIMVMIANRKEKSQMKEDLLLFLGKSTNKFVDWLFEIFQRLQSAGATGISENSTAATQQPNKKKDQLASEKKGTDDVEVEKKTKKEKESESRHADTKDIVKHKEKEKPIEKDHKESRVVKSKITFHHQPSSKSPPHEKSHSKKKKKKGSTVSAEKVINKDAVSSRVNERDAINSTEVKKRKEFESLPQKRVEEKGGRREISTRIQFKEKRNYIGERNNSPKHISKHPKVSSPKEYIDSDEEERLAEEESRKELYSKKVLSSAVLKMTQSESVKTVSSKVIVKRKLPEKENTKNVRGAQSLFLKAIKEAGRMTRTASQMAGYGAGTPLKKMISKSTNVATVEPANDNYEEDAIEIDDVDSIDGDTLVVAASNSVDNNVRRQVDERSSGNVNNKINISPVVSESNAADKKERGLTTSSSSRSLKFDAKSEHVELKKEPNEPVAAKTKKLLDSNIGEADSNSNLNLSPDSGEVLTVVNDEASTNKQSGSWDRQIPIDEDDSSDDEAQIDAVLASAHTITVGFDEGPIVSSTNASDVAETGQQSANPDHSNNNAAQAGESLLTVAPGEKIMERCKFWPNCRLEDACIYIHPTKPCSNFPNCKFGDRCIYLHYPCKFDRNCVNPHCPYVHSSKINIGTTSVSTPGLSAPTPTTSTTTVAAPLNASIACKYGGKCTNPSCVYKHPKLCRFGERCTNRNCYFRHLNMLPTSTLKSASLDKYKWKATVST